MAADVSVTPSIVEGGAHTVFRALREMYRQARHEQMHINQSVLIGIICIICA